MRKNNWEDIPRDDPILSVENDLIQFIWNNDETGFLAEVEKVKHLVPRFHGRLMDWLCFFSTLKIKNLDTCDSRLIRHLLQLGCPPHTTALMDVIRWRRDTELADAFLTAGARLDPNIWFEFFVPPQKMVRWLLSKGCDHTVKNDGGKTPLEEWKNNLVDPRFTQFLTEEGRFELEASIALLESHTRAKL